MGAPLMVIVWSPVHAIGSKARCFDGVGSSGKHAFKSHGHRWYSEEKPRPLTIVRVHVDGESVLWRILTGTLTREYGSVQTKG